MNRLQRQDSKFVLEARTDVASLNLLQAQLHQLSLQKQRLRRHITLFSFFILCLALWY